MAETHPKRVKRRKSVKRKTSRRSKTGRKNPALSERWKKIWADPERAAAMVEKRNATIAAMPKEVTTRAGVPDGMRKPKAQRLWKRARKKAKRFIQIMEDAGEVEKIVVPGSEAEMAKQALEEAFAMAVGPATDAKVKTAALRLVLDFTKAKPESKTKLTLDKSEEWLDALEADMKANGRSSSDPTPSA